MGASGWARADDPRDTDTVIHVLHVDDDPAALEATRGFLERDSNRFEVQSETAVAAALATLAEGGVDCIVSDYELVGVDGLAFLREVRSREPDLPFIIFTEDGTETLAAEATSAGVTDYIRKGSPDAHVVLADRIVQLVGRPDGAVFPARRAAATAATDEEQSLLDAITEFSVLSLDATGHVTTWNTGARLLHGYEPAEILGEHVSVLYPPTSAADGLPERHLELAVERGSFHTEGWRVRRDGEQYWADVTLTPVERNGESGGFACVMHDLTDRLEQDQKRQRRLEQLDQFASVLSHDLRTPLSVAAGRLELARQDPENAAEHLDRVDEAHGRIEALIDSLLLLAQEGDVVSEMRTVRLESTLTLAWGLVELPAAQLAVEGDLGKTAADAERLQTLFENLFRNSLEHGGPDVTVTVGPLDDGFYVADDGPGIPASERERVFEYGHTTAEAGSGFGLSIVWNIADAHGWTLTLTDAEMGGARFEFTGLSIESDG